MLSGATLNKVPRNHVIASRFRALAERCLFLERNYNGLVKLEKYLNESMVLHPENVETYILTAKSFILRSELASHMKTEGDKLIVSALNKAHEIDPQNTEIKILLAIMFMDKNEYNLAEDYLRDIQENTNNSVVLELQGDCYAKRNNCQKALELYTMALKRQPKSHRLHVKRGYCLLAKGDFLEALLGAIKGITLCPNYKTAFDLKKQSTKLAGKTMKRSPRWVEADFMSRIDEHEIKVDLYAGSFENDPLTGFATEDSLRIWCEQTSLGNEFSAVTVFLDDLRMMSLYNDKAWVNKFIKCTASVIRNTLKSALFYSRPSADKLVVFISRDSLNKKLPALRNRLKRLSGFLKLYIGIGEGESLKKSLGESIRESLKSSRNGGSSSVGA